MNTTAEAKARAGFERLLGCQLPIEGGALNVGGQSFIYADGILRSMQAVSANQRQTSDAFGFKWSRRDTYESPAVLSAVQEWLLRAIRFASRNVVVVCRR